MNELREFIFAIAFTSSRFWELIESTVHSRFFRGRIGGSLGRDSNGKQSKLITLWIDDELLPQVKARIDTAENRALPYHCMARCVRQAFLCREACGLIEVGLGIK